MKTQLCAMTKELNDQKSQREAQNLGYQANYSQNPHYWGPTNNQNWNQRNSNIAGNWNQNTTVSAITVVEIETVVQTGILGRTVRITVAHVSHKQELHTMQAQNP